MVTIAIIAILATIAVPSFQRQIASTRLSNATNDVLASLAQARNDAIRTGVRMTVCKSNSGTDCVTGAGSDWNDGWITVADSTRTSATPAVDTGETIGQINQGFGPSIVIKGDAALADYVSFTSEGRPKYVTGGFQAGRLRVCNTSTSLTDNERARDIELVISGRAVVRTPASAVAATCPAPT